MHTGTLIMSQMTTNKSAQRYQRYQCIKLHDRQATNVTLNTSMLDDMHRKETAGDDQLYMLFYKRFKDNAHGCEPNALAFDLFGDDLGKGVAHGPVNVHSQVRLCRISLFIPVT